MWKDLIKLALSICIISCGSLAALTYEQTYSAPRLNGFYDELIQNVNSMLGETQQAGAAYFQLNNFNDQLYPLCAASQDYSATSSLPTPYRSHSWLGGMLWGTGQLQSDLFSPNGAVWTQSLFSQHPVWADPLIIEYLQPPNAVNSAPSSRGINISMPAPFLQADAPYGSCSSTFSPPLTLIAPSGMPTLIIQPATAAPGNAPIPPAWSPIALLVDRMGDWDVDLIFQDPANPYTQTPFTAPSQGNYIKMTAAKGCPYAFCEAGGEVSVVVIQNQIINKVATTTAVVPGVTNVSYALYGGDQSVPGIPLNPSDMQNNFTTFALFWKTDTATFTADNIGVTPNSYLSFNNSGTGEKNWFVIAAIPTLQAYPTTGQTYSQALGQAAVNYAEALGQHAFNFLVDTEITYSIADMYLVTTNFTASLTNPYLAVNPQLPAMTTDSNTVMALMPHQYQSATFAPGIAPPVLNLNGSTAFTPAGPPTLTYWTIVGNLMTILGNTFQTNYIFNNFLPCMPPPNVSDPVASTLNNFTSTIGDLLFNMVDNEFINNSNPAFAPWGTGYLTFDKGIYDIGPVLSNAGKQIGIIQGLYQRSTQGATFTEAPYNSNANPLPSNRPGASLSASLQASVEGVQNALSQYFNQTPVASTGGYKLSHFANYDTLAHSVNLFPTSGSPAGPIFPSRVSVTTMMNGAASTSLWESFGVADMLNDHHYQYGYWISAAALAVLYDGSWLSIPQPGTWGTESQYGSAIDQYVMDLAYDPANASFWTIPNMTFPKMQFFDQWAGHGWADGLQGGFAGGAGHNENSIQEGNQAFASIILWGIATGRPEIADLGIYLYTTATYAADAYFYDKNLNYKPGGSFFVPSVTESNNPTFPQGTTFWDNTIHTASSSGLPKLSQSQLNYSTDFGQTAANIKFISAFPCTSWTMAIGRNTDYMNEWNESMNTPGFNALITQSASACWQPTYIANMNMLCSLGASSFAYGNNTSNTSLSPMEFYANQMLLSDPNGSTVPWNAGLNTTSQPVSETLQFLYTTDTCDPSYAYYGTPNWAVYGKVISTTTVPSIPYAFTAAFIKNGVTTYTCFNPNFETITVQFYNVLDNSVASSPFTVPPKQWNGVSQ